MGNPLVLSYEIRSVIRMFYTLLGPTMVFLLQWVMPTFLIALVLRHFYKLKGSK